MHNLSSNLNPHTTTHSAVNLFSIGVVIKKNNHWSANNFETSILLFKMSKKAVYHNAPYTCYMLLILYNHTLLIFTKGANNYGINVSLPGNRCSKVDVKTRGTECLHVCVVSEWRSERPLVLTRPWLLHFLAAINTWVLTCKYYANCMLIASGATKRACCQEYLWKIGAGSLTSCKCSLNTNK